MGPIQQGPAIGYYALAAGVLIAALVWVGWRLVMQDRRKKSQTSSPQNPWLGLEQTFIGQREQWLRADGHNSFFAAFRQALCLRYRDLSEAMTSEELLGFFRQGQGLAEEEKLTIVSLLEQEANIRYAGRRGEAEALRGQMESFEELVKQWKRQYLTNRI